MLSPADAELVRRDTDLPGLGIVLDAEALAERLARVWPERSVLSPRAVYLRYKPRTSCLVAYRFTGPEGEVDLHAVARSAAAGTKLDKARDRARRARAGRAVTVLEDSAVVVSEFPEDASLPVLVRLAERDRRRRLLRRLLGRRGPSGPLVRLRYKPERRFVAGVAGEDGPDLILKAHAAGGFDAGLRGALAWRPRPPLAVARLLGALPQHGLLAFERVPGRVLAEAIVSGQAGLADLERVGQAIAQVHAAPSAGLLARGPLAEARHVRAVAATMAFVQPAQAPRAEYLAREIASRLAARPPLERPTHGDFHAGQVLLDGETAALIDFDEACLGDPGSDLGCFLAHLERESCAGRVRADAASALAEALLAGYGRSAARPSDGALGLRVAAALFRLAPHFFRDRDPDWPERTAAALDRVERHLAGHGAARVSVALPSPAPEDPRNPFLAAALDAMRVEDGLRALPHLQSLVPHAAVQSIRVLRHKPGRRCLIEYALVSPKRGPEPLLVLGKVRARGADFATCSLARRLHGRGFAEDSPDGISVPRPLGAVPALGMWLQARVGGAQATSLLEGEAGPALGARLADALHKLHGADVPPGRRHTVVDELAILCDRLERAARERPPWAGRLARLAEACVSAAAGLPTEKALVHRDFYADQVLVDGDRLYLLDLDLCAAGDPALDAGNFAGHVVEQALRGRGDPRALDEPKAAFVDRFLARRPRATGAAVDVYTTLTLARHVWISTQFPDRRGSTAALLDLCEQRLDLGAPARKVTHAL